LNYNLNHNTLFSFNNYKDNNKIQLDNEIFEMVEKIKKIQEQQKRKHDSRIIVPGR